MHPQNEGAGPMEPVWPELLDHLMADHGKRPHATGNRLAGKNCLSWQYALTEAGMFLW